MESDLAVSLETKPALTTEELREVFEAAGDEHFHKNIVDTDISGEAPAKVAPANISIELDQREGGRLEGMEVEVGTFLRRELADRGIDYTNLQVGVVPTREEIEEMIAE